MDIHRENITYFGPKCQTCMYVVVEVCNAVRSVDLGMLRVSDTDSTKCLSTDNMLQYDPVSQDRDTPSNGVRLISGVTLMKGQAHFATTHNSISEAVLMQVLSSYNKNSIPHCQPFINEVLCCTDVGNSDDICRIKVSQKVFTPRTVRISSPRVSDDEGRSHSEPTCGDGGRLDKLATKPSVAEAVGEVHSGSKASALRDIHGKLATEPRLLLEF